MNILIHSHLYPNTAKPLIGNFVENFSRSLISSGHYVSVISPIPYVPKGIPRSHPWYRYKFVLSKYQKAGIKVYHPRFLSIPKRLFFFFRGELMYYSAYSFYNRLLKSEDFDIIHCHVALPDGVVGSYLSKKFKISYGITIHGADIYESLPENNLNYKKIKKVIENAGFIGVVSNRLYDLILNEKIIPPAETTRVIYNGVNIPLEKMEVKLKNSKKKSIKLLSVGHMIRRKGIDFVLRALSMLKNKYSNIEYFVIGDGHDLDYFKKIAEEFNVQGITHFLGAKDNLEVFEYMKLCDLFVLPSLNESFGIVFIEAMSQGMITIGTFGEGISDVIKDGFNGFLVKPRNVEDLYLKLCYLITNLDRLNAVRQNARLTVLSKFTWENNVREYIKLYNQTKKYYE